MDFKLIGGILLVVGTSIGAGMLALPVVTAQMGFLPACILLFLAWALMTFCALLMLEVNLWLPRNSNIISMSTATLGPLGGIISWISYLLLLYTILSAYTSGGSDVLHHFLYSLNIDVSQSVTSVIFVCLIGVIVYQGIYLVDYVNRYLMSTKLISYLLLLIFIFPFIEMQKLKHLDLVFPVATMLVMITSFGFATIVPSLRIYYQDDVKKLRTIILVGSLIPLICYISWVWVIHGVLPTQGPNGLLALVGQDQTTTRLVHSLSVQVTNPWLSALADVFSSLSVVTSFLGTSLGLSDFLSDGLGVEKKGKGKVFVYLLTFLPPLIIILFFPNFFVRGIAYAGTCCAILMMLIPCLMAYSGRYHRKIARGYQVAGGKSALSVVIIVSLVLAIASLWMNV